MGKRREETYPAQKAVCERIDSGELEFRKMGGALPLRD